MAATPEIEQAAKQAAERVRRLIVQMLADGEIGEVAVVIGYHELEPEKRVTTKAKTVKVARGQMTVIDRAG